MANGTSTLASNEARWSFVVYLVMCLCSTIGILILVASCRALLAHPSVVGWNAWGLCLLLWGLLTVSNARYLWQHGHTTVGMMPVSVTSLAPACLSALIAPVRTGVVALVASFGLVLALATAVVLMWWFHRMRTAYAKAPTPTKDAVIIVLGGAIRNGAPGATLALRLDAALRAWEASHGRMLVLTGGLVRGERTSEAEAMAAYLAARGVPPSSMMLEAQARNTRENVALSLELVRKRGLDRQLCVLSSDYHLYRALREGQRLGAALVPMAAPTPLPSRLQQWCREVLTILAKG